jgi:hypothetical protein
MEKVLDDRETGVRLDQRGEGSGRGCGRCHEELDAHRFARGVEIDGQGVTELFGRCDGGVGQLYVRGVRLWVVRHEHTHRLPAGWLTALGHRHDEGGIAVDDDDEELAPGWGATDDDRPGRFVGGRVSILGFGDDLGYFGGVDGPLPHPLSGVFGESELHSNGR